MTWLMVFVFGDIFLFDFNLWKGRLKICLSECPNTLASEKEGQTPARGDMFGIA